MLELGGSAGTGDFIDRQPLGQPTAGGTPGCQWQEKIPWSKEARDGNAHIRQPERFSECLPDIHHNAPGQPSTVQAARKLDGTGHLQLRNRHPIQPLTPTIFFLCPWQCLMRPITLHRAEMSPIIESILRSMGIRESKDIVHQISSFTTLWNSLLSTPKKLGMKDSDAFFLWVCVLKKCSGVFCRDDLVDQDSGEAWKSKLLQQQLKSSETSGLSQAAGTSNSRWIPRSPGQASGR